MRTHIAIATALFTLTRAAGAETSVPNALARLQKALGVPQGLARIVDAQTEGRSLPEFVLIQDVHRHAEVQNEIAAILLHGRRHWRLSTVFVEGAFNEVPTDCLRENAEHTSLVSLVREGRLSGAEMAAAMGRQGTPLRLLGIEEESLYKQNLEAYQKVEQLRDQALDELNTIRMLQTSFGLANAKYDSETLDAMERLLRLKWRATDQARFANKIPTPESPTLRQALEAAEAFYAAADARSEAFLTRSISTDTIGPRVLIVGGYHTAEMATKLREQGHTFVVLAPQVTQPADEAMYRERLQESISALKITSPE